MTGVGGGRAQGGEPPGQRGTDLDLPGVVQDNQAQQDDGREADEAFECK